VRRDVHGLPTKKEWKFNGFYPCAHAGIDMLKKTANVDASYGLSPEELKAKVALSDALIVRSATKVSFCTSKFSNYCVCEVLCEHIISATSKK